jgi:50S ribosomal subunit-associated GTPase HflX
MPKREANIGTADSREIGHLVEVCGMKPAIEVLLRRRHSNPSFILQMGKSLTDGVPAAFSQPQW